MPPPSRASATAKINLALVVGELRPDGLHPVATVLQRVALADRVALEGALALRVTGFDGDTLVRRALSSLGERAGVRPTWHVHLDKRVPVAAGLGGGSSDAATALRLANDSLPAPLPEAELHALAATIGADVPFFLTAGPQLGQGTGTELTALRLPSDYWVLLLLPHRAAKASTAAVYGEFDASGRAARFAKRRGALLEALERVTTAADLAGLPPNDLADSPYAARLRELGAFRADVSGAGPALYGLFRDRDSASSAARALASLGRTWVTVPAWYG